MINDQLGGKAQVNRIPRDIMNGGNRNRSPATTKTQDLGNFAAGTKSSSNKVYLKWNKNNKKS